MDHLHQRWRIRLHKRYGLGYRLWNPVKRKVVYSQDVVFREVKDVIKHEFQPKEREKIEFELKEEELDSTAEEESEDEELENPSVRRSIRERRQSKSVSQEEEEDMSRVPYASAIGSLMYAMVCTRLDIPLAVGVLSRSEKILVATDYFTKWIEDIPTKNVNHQVVIKFLNENIFTIFGCPTKLVTDNAIAFKAKELVDMTESMGIQVVHSNSYYPQGSSLAESSNKSLVRVIKRMLEDTKKSWDSKLKFALWADRVTIKNSIGNSPFKLVYGANVIFPIQLILPVAKFLQEGQDEENDMIRRMNNLVKL
eukprot:PITA_04289